MGNIYQFETHCHFCDAVVPEGSLDAYGACSLECSEKGARQEEEYVMQEFAKCQSQRPESGCPLRNTPECGDDCWTWWDIQ